MLLRILFIITSTVTLGITGGFIGSLLLTTVKGQSSLEGGAYVFWFVCIGMLIGFVTGLLSGKRLTQSSLRTITFISTLITAVLIAGLVIIGRTKVSRPSEKRVQPTAVPASFKQVDPMPMGLGMVKVRMNPNNKLYFFREPEVNQLPEESKPIDSLTLDKTGVAVDTAPPFLLPESFKPDYGIIHFRAISINRSFIEIIVNKQTMATAFVDRNTVDYFPWPEFYLTTFSVYPVDLSNNPVRARPFENGSPVKIPTAQFSLSAVSAHGDWLKVQISDVASMKGGEFGYIRWRDGKSLLLRYSLLS